MGRFQICLLLPVRMFQMQYFQIVADRMTDKYATFKQINNFTLNSSEWFPIIDIFGSNSTNVSSIIDYLEI